MHSNRYTIIFALAVCVTCSVILALTAGGLKPTIEKNEKFDIQRNILKAVDLFNADDELTVEQVESLYAERIRGFVIGDDGKLVADRTPATIDPSTDPGLLPVFARIDDGSITGYCLPVSGKGLWSTLYGYIALEDDANTIMGVTFYKHGETPGLGGEVDKAWFTDGFKGKTIFDAAGNLTAITVAKGAVSPDLPDTARDHMVDGISGATMTGNGINVFLKADLEKYLPFLKTIQDGNPPAITGA